MTTLTSFGSTSRVQYRYAIEATQNVLPAVPFNNIIVKSGSLEAGQTYVISAGITTDGTIPDHTLASRVPSGSVPFEFSYGAGDPFIAAILEDAVLWNQPTSNNAAVTATSPSTFNVASGGASYLAGMLINSSGFLAAADNGVFVVASNSASTVVVTAATLATDVASTATAALKVVGVQGASGDIVSTAATLGVATLTSTVLDFTTLGLSVGMVIKIGGSATAMKYATAANNDFVRITGIAAHTLAIDNCPTGWAADVGAAKTIRLSWGDVVRNGATRTSFTLEEDHPDISFTRDFSGMFPDSLAVKITPGQIIEGTPTFKGQSVTTGTTSAGTGTAIAVPGNPLMNAVRSVVRVNEAGVTAGKMSDATLSIKRALVDALAVGVLGLADVGNARIMADLAFSMYMTTATGVAIYNKHLTDTASSVFFILQDTAGNMYSIDLPSGKFTAATTPVAGLDQMYKGTFTFNSRRDSVTGYQIVVNRIPAIAV